MAASGNALQVTVVSAVATVWEGEAKQVVAKTTEGEIGIRPGHTPVLALLASGEVRVTTREGEVVRAQADGGFFSVSEDEVNIVAGEAAIVE